MIKLELSEEMIKIIGMALARFPVNAGAPVIQEIHRQVQEQAKVTQ